MATDNLSGASASAGAGGQLPATPPVAATDDTSGGAALLDEVYAQLRAIAQNRLNDESPRHTLQATALVHEAWLKLCERSSVMALDRRRFVIAAAEAMRRVLIDHSRSRDRVKRGGGVAPQQIIAGAVDVLELASEQDPEQIVALDRAVCRLEHEHPQGASVVKLRFFAGLSVGETAEALDISERTVKRQWRFARAWLFRALS